MEIKTYPFNHSYLSFPIYSRREIETRILERKSKQKISRFIDFIYRLFTNFLYARLKNGRIMLYPSASVRPSVRLSVNFFVSV